ncbi:MAG: hypothetical protein ACFFAO_20980, partial [Candidatus Hermodarchaeota archaeon]
IEYSFNLPQISTKELILKKSDSDPLDVLHNIEFKFKKPGKIIETIENIGIPPNLDNPKAFKVVLDGIYSTITKEAYKISINVDKK